MSSQRRPSSGNNRLIGSKSTYRVYLQSTVVCHYCNKRFLVSCIGHHFSTSCEKAQIAKGKSKKEIEEKKQNAKHRRNEYERRRRQDWEFKLLQNKKRWIKEFGPPRPDHRFLNVPKYNCFHWSKESKELEIGQFSVQQRKEFADILFPLLEKGILICKKARTGTRSGGKPIQDKFYSAFKPVLVTFHTDM